MTHHRWSGWPGAWCLDCGMPDLDECALADGGLNFRDDSYDKESVIIWSDEGRELLSYALNTNCPEPGSQRFDPYAHRSGVKFDYERVQL